MMDDQSSEGSNPQLRELEPITIIKIISPAGAFSVYGHILLCNRGGALKKNVLGKCAVGQIRLETSALEECYNLSLFLCFASEAINRKSVRKKSFFFIRR